MSYQVIFLLVKEYIILQIIHPNLFFYFSFYFIFFSVYSQSSSVPDFFSYGLIIINLAYSLHISRLAARLTRSGHVPDITWRVRPCDVRPSYCILMYIHKLVTRTVIFGGGPARLNMTVIPTEVDKGVKDKRQPPKSQLKSTKAWRIKG